MIQEQDSYYKESMLYEVGQLHSQMIDTKMIDEVRTLVINREDTSSSIQKLQMKYRESKASLRYSSTFPSIYYESLLCSIDELAKVGHISAQDVSSSWLSLVRLALYMSCKRIPIDKYGACFLSNPSIMQQLEVIPLSRFGAVNCQIVNFYCFISVGSAISQLKEVLGSKLAKMEQHFKGVNQLGQEQEQIIKNIEGKDNEKVCNYFLEKCPTEEEWKLFISNINQHNNLNSYCQIFLISQPPQSHYTLNNLKYPISIQTISNAYLQAYSSCKNQRLLKDKVVELRKVTRQLSFLRDTPLPSFKIIPISIHTQTENPLIEAALKQTLSSQTDEDKDYYLLMARMDKYKANTAKWQLDPSLANAITSKTYATLPALQLHS